jgi:photosystem II stability/assembly factor-like uncharacterized protein
MSFRIAALLALALAAPAAAADRWRVQYFYDEDKSSLAIVDLQFPSPARGIAVGFIAEGRRRKPVSVLTSDGGAHWQTAALPDDPVSLFFLNESLGWLVTDKGGLWQTTEAGKNWKKLPKIPGRAVRVCFVDEKRGWAAADKKQVFATEDGGLHWTALPAAAEPAGKPEYSMYNWIAFATPQHGMVTGFNLPPRRMPQRPAWLDPEDAATGSELPHLSYALVTVDGGKTWKANSASLFGEITRVRLLNNGNGLGLIQYAAGFRFPSEVYRIEWATGKSSTVYRDRNFNVSDIWILPNGEAYLAGNTVVGQMRGIVPGKVQVLRSRNLSAWSQLEVDYRAVANQVVLAGAGDSLWMATDSGMILKLTSQ